MSTTTRPAYGTPEWNAAFDAQRKALGYPSRDELAAIDRRFPIIGAKAADAEARVIPVDFDSTAERTRRQREDARYASFVSGRKSA